MTNNEYQELMQKLADKQDTAGMMVLLDMYKLHEEITNLFEEVLNGNEKV